MPQVFIGLEEGNLEKHRLQRMHFDFWVSDDSIARYRVHRRTIIFQSVVTRSILNFL